MLAFLFDLRGDLGLDIANPWANSVSLPVLPKLVQAALYQSLPNGGLATLRNLGNGFSPITGSV
jgi:hypothetical protein